VDPKTNAVFNYGKEAWRSVGYVIPDEAGMPIWVPVSFDALEHIIAAKFKMVDAKFEAAQQGLLRVEDVLNARLKHLEECR
jgi:hypothetical protein